MTFLMLSFIGRYMKMKKVWETPEVVAVVHGSPEEAVLMTCYDSLTCEFESAADPSLDLGIELAALS